MLCHEDLKMVYFSVAMAVYFWMAIYNLLDKAQKNVKFIEQVSRIFGVFSCQLSASNIENQQIRLVD